MRQSALLWQAVEELQEAAAQLQAAVPEHWRGRAAQTYQRTAANFATGVALAAQTGREAAALAHQHEQQAAAIQTALAAGAPVAV